MAKNKSRPKWGKPKLLIFTRSKPEEAILVGCKNRRERSGSDAVDEACKLLGGCQSCFDTVAT